MGKWPRDTQADLIKFYGDPASKGKDGVAAQLVKVVPPFKMYYDGRPLKSLSFHKKAAPALMAALNDIWVRYGKDQSMIDRLGISKCAGTYNPRKVRGSNTRWSNHAFGAAIDLNAEENGFNAKSTIPLPVIAAFKRQGARWGGDYKTRKDPMHFEFCEPASVSTAALSAVELPSMDDGDITPDAGMDMNPPPAHDVAPDAAIPSAKVPLLRRVWTWLTSGGVAVGGLLYDYRIVVAIVGLLVIAAVGALWLFGREAIREWVSRQVNG